MAFSTRSLMRKQESLFHESNGGNTLETARNNPETDNRRDCDHQRCPPGKGRRVVAKYYTEGAIDNRCASRRKAASKDAA